MRLLTRTAIGQLDFFTGSRAQLTQIFLDELRSTTLSPGPSTAVLSERAHEALSDIAEATSLNSLDNSSNKQSPNQILGFINPHVFNLSVEHTMVQQFLNDAAFVCIDGIGIKLAIAMTRGQWLPRVVAEHLFTDFMDSLQFPVDAVLIGGRPGVADRAAKAMTLHNPQLHIIDTLDGYQTMDCYRQLLNSYHQTPLILIGAGSPKSETIALTANDICSHSVIFHIGGGTLNTYAGEKKRGPHWISALGCEWIHRMIYEPHTRQRYTCGAWQFVNHLRTHHRDRPQPLNKST